MSGAIHARRGFNYQDTVILDLLITHFDEHGSSATVRPEGIDDLDLAWIDAEGFAQKRFVQVKKPREDAATTPTDAPWTLPGITTHLIPGTLSRLKDNEWEQVWILGDAVSADAQSLVAAGNDAAVLVPQLYWLTVHRLARNKILALASLDNSVRNQLANWRPSAELLADPHLAIQQLVEAFGKKLKRNASDEIQKEYARVLNQTHSALPDVLSRLHIKPTFGSEDEVSERIQRLLHERYKLDPSVVANILFRNLRAFVDDISRIPGRQFDREEFETELRTIWPTMMAIRHPPPLDERHLRRPDLSSLFTSQWSGRALEVIGISGAGKTMLAAEVYEKSRSEDPDRPVFYAEVRLATELRDVLIAVAFHLRRYQVTHAFGIASTHAAGTTAHDEALWELAHCLAAVPTEFLLLIDLIEGCCSENFSRDLRTLLNACSTTGYRLAVLGQESAFRHFTNLDREQLGVNAIDVRGFRFDEFLGLVRQNYDVLDYEVLRQVYDSLTAGRSAGLYGRLARSLADAPSYEKMRDLARSPPEKLLQLAERQKFAQLSTTAQSAAEKLACIALPFSRHEAESVFQDMNVGLAIQELLDLGLLRSAGTDTFEMHETVRAGLEGAIALDTKRNAHSALAAHYARTDLLSTEIFHLEQAGEESHARIRAKTAFLEGKHWSTLYGYVVPRKLVTLGEAIDVVTSADPIEGSYLLPDIVSTLGKPADADKLLEVIHSQLARFGSDYNWSSAVAGAYLCLAPEKAHVLYRIAILVNGHGGQRESAISSVLIASRRHGTRNPANLIALFDGLSDQLKPLLVPALFDNGKRDCLRRAFKLIESDSLRAPEKRVVRLDFPYLRVSSVDDVVEFLASVPEVSDGRMLALQSPLLGRFAAFVWAHRETFENHCIGILKSESIELRVQKAAIRVLALTANRQLCEICDELATQTDNPIHGFAALAPSLTPGLVDSARYEARLFDAQNALQNRVSSLHILALSGTDLDRVYRKLLEVEGTNRATGPWELLFLQFASKNPFPAALPLLEAQLSSTSSNSSPLIGPVKALGLLAVPEAVEMLVRALSHPDPSIRTAAALALEERRSQTALEPLKRQLYSENDKKIRTMLAAAICASGPASVDDLNVPYAGDQNILLWQCNIAARTRDRSFAPTLIATALDTSLNWQLRRAAISAAGLLPFEVALKYMLPILRERSTLIFDRRIDLYAHSFLSYLLLNEANNLLPLFTNSREQFIDFIGELYEEQSRGLIDSRDLAAGDAVGNWIYNRLSEADWPSNSNAPDTVINDLNTPLLFSAVLRSLRRANRLDLIEAEIPHCKELWFVTKCVVECVRSGYSGSDDSNRLRGLIARSAVAGDPRLDRIIQEVSTTTRTPKHSTPIPNIPDALSSTNVSYDEAVRFLTTGANPYQLSAQSPVVLEDLTLEQFKHLVHLANPGNDPDQSVERYVPGISFRGTSHTVANRQVSHSSGKETPASFIRPAIVAANVYDAAIYWHDELLKSSFSKDYIHRVLGCIAVSGNESVLYDLLNRYSEDFLQALGSYPTCENITPLLDERIIPVMASSVTSGTDEMLESLTRLSRVIETSEIDGVLSFLFNRWTTQYEIVQSTGFDDSNHHYWRAFRNLSDHPRFDQIKDWPSRLTPILYSPHLAWFRKQDLARVLERDPRSYIHLENVRFKAQDWEHFYQEEIDLLDQACDRLFRQCE